MFELIMILLLHKTRNDVFQKKHAFQKGYFKHPRLIDAFKSNIINPVIDYPGLI